ncbi:short chain dehydrogenase reductase family [Lentinula edodes]|uniref:Short chain dehydrogenase reductase family n=1 Tax=Lentinula edodes TaxID=5353 RepID=A0A1Q3EPV5_LENED|nr:short chain dehydrogenase reductase family [Lentinula edodes]
MSKVSPYIRVTKLYITMPAHNSLTPMHGQRSDDHQFSPLKLFNVEGLVAVVTGGGSGIGLMMATALENNGAVVYIVGRRHEVLERAAQENSRFNNIIPLQGDITNLNNAGIARNLYVHPLPSPEDSPEARSPPSPPASPSCEPSHPSIKAFQSALWDSGTPDDFAETFATNVTAPYYTTVAFLELLHQGNLRQQETVFSSFMTFPPFHSSQVITVSSSGSFRVDPKIVSMSYTLSKTATTHLGKCLANLLAPWSIRSNVLAPGVWPSEMTNSRLSPNFKLDPRVMAMSVPLKRAGTEEEMAGTILFLASKAGAYVNGAVWLIDGGRVNSVASSY